MRVNIKTHFYWKNKKMFPWQTKQDNFTVCNISLHILFQTCDKQFSVLFYHSLYSKRYTKFLRSHYFHSWNAGITLQSDNFSFEFVTAIFRMFLFVRNFKDVHLTAERHCYLEGCKWDSLWFLVININTLRTGDEDLRFYITTVQDGWRKSEFLTRACFPCAIHLVMQYIEPVSEWFCWRMFIEIRTHSELNFRHRASSI